MNELHDRTLKKKSIAWYPSCGMDFRALFYLHPLYADHNPASEAETFPEVFFYTDYYRHNGDSDFVRGSVLYADDRTKVTVLNIEELPKLNLSLNDHLIDISKPHSYSNRMFDMKLSLETPKGNIQQRVIYAYVMNEAFYAHYLVPNKISVSYIVHVRYGVGFGGAKASGAWLLNVLDKLNCKVFVSDGQHDFHNGDHLAVQYFEEIPNQCTVQLHPIRTIPGSKWSNHGDVTWHKISC